MHLFNILCTYSTRGKLKPGSRALPVNQHLYSKSSRFDSAEPASSAATSVTTCISTISTSPAKQNSEGIIEKKRGHYQITPSRAPRRTRMMVEMLSRYLLSPALLGLGSGRVLSWWFGCLRLFAILWFRVLWASASVVEVTTVPTLRWLLTLGLISLVLFIFFVSILSRLSLTRRTPESQAGL